MALRSPCSWRSNITHWRPSGARCASRSAGDQCHVDFPGIGKQDAVLDIFRIQTVAFEFVEDQVCHAAIAWRPRNVRLGCEARVRLPL